MARGDRPAVSSAQTGRQAVEAVWRIESARIVGALARLTGDFALAEDLAQEALAEALVAWPRDGGCHAARPADPVQRARHAAPALVAPYNLIISNVPGPDMPLYLAGAELLAYYPVSAIFDGNGLNITVMSYRGTLYFGLVACRELMPGLDDLAEYLRAELDELLTVAAGNH